MDYDQFFRNASGANRAPYAYQRRLACGLGDDSTQGSDCHSRLIDVPTGCGKTAAVVLAWLWNRVWLRRPGWPRRLVFCLPMRTLVEQTRAAIDQWLVGSKLRDQVDLHALMGGVSGAGAWDIYPEREAILVGTQDMLLSRALNRGYGTSRYRWPLGFGLLNNDCLWVMDEIQAMGPALATTSQLDAFRNALWGAQGNCPSWWMSATVSESTFKSTDRVTLRCAVPETFALLGHERDELTRAGRLGVEKSVALLNAPPRDVKSILQEHVEHVSGRVTLIIANTVPSALRYHQEIRAQINASDDKPKRGKKNAPAPPKPSAPAPRLLLLHSRFRRHDRKPIIDELTAFMKRQAESADGQVPDHPGYVVVATQVVEAGLDLSATRLWSEVAPWPSVIQRLGRLNRDGRQPGAQACFWKPKKDEVENGVDAPNAAKRLGPYPIEELNASQQLIAALAARLAAGQGYGAALDAALDSPESRAALEIPPQVCLRPDDVYGLFSTEPDLAGGFTNIAPYVRQEDRNTDLLVYWRDFKLSPGNNPDDTEADAGADELVAVPVYELQRFMGKIGQAAFLWDEESESWQRLRAADLVPGMEVLLPISAGGYSSAAGWTGRGEDKPTPVPSNGAPLARLGGDPESAALAWQTIAEHTGAVVVWVETLARRLALPEDIRNTMIRAAEWHDVGKAHPCWQEAAAKYAEAVTGRIEACAASSANPKFAPILEKLRAAFAHPDRQKTPLAKFPDVRGACDEAGLSPEEAAELKKRLSASFRPNRRHEADSLLAGWERRQAGTEGFTALALYLIAAHHGKVRTALRSDSRGGNLFGLRENDPPLPLPDGSSLNFYPELNSFLSFSGAGSFDWELGTFTPQRSSWQALMDELLGPAWRDDPAPVEAIGPDEPRALGPFRLAYLEAVFRAADVRASRGENPSLQPS